MTATGLLPVTVDIEPGEDIAAYCQRLGDANYLTFRDLTGHRRTARAWENPSGPLLATLAAISGISQPRLTAATLRGAYPGIQPERARTGRRYAGQPATCPRGCGQSVAARLNLIVLCPSCDQLLVDRLDPTPPPVPDKVVQVQPEVIATLDAATSSPAARDRLRRLESLMAELEPALWTTWPPLFPGETEQWRARVANWVHEAVVEGRSTIARPPSVTATLLALTWDASAKSSSTDALLDGIAIMADPWDPDPDEMPPWGTLLDAHDGLLDALEELGITPRHVPSILRRSNEPIILPEHQRTHRTAEALALTALASHAHGEPMSIPAAAKLHAAGTSRRAQRVATRLLNSTYALCRLAVHARRLRDAGLRDLVHTRTALRDVKHLPPGEMRNLPGVGDASADPQVAAGWVWLDATGGRPAGGPHPKRAAAEVLEFDSLLSADSKRDLRTWWQQRLSDTTDLTVHDTKAPPGDRPERGQRRG